MSTFRHDRRPILCQWCGCDEIATVRIVRANTYVCDDHYLANVVRFGCEFETDPVGDLQKDTAE